jgi:hypothetical protein
MLGRRVKADKDGYLKGLEQPGDYGRVERTPEQVHYCLDQLYWQVIAPDGSRVKLNPGTHLVIEHSDKTITVHPSIVTPTWHGWLKAGVWESV